MQESSSPDVSDEPRRAPRQADRRVCIGALWPEQARHASPRRPVPGERGTRLAPRKGAALPTGDPVANPPTATRTPPPAPTTQDRRMLYLGTASGPQIRQAMTEGRLGQMVTPQAGNRVV